MGQYEIAQQLIEEMNRDICELDEVTPDFLLDIMGVIGVEFAIGEKASLAFIAAQA